ncbi:MaoC family dehydratase N-terminal domain-containing protein [Pseudonocardia hispaniensis]|uniref:MaoC family dehydratase N-terminal domain-containing protein n=1 Tax=Pseudonocardia hispaniensis TaxID=904933 RepID=A0ABW1IYV0_9PSEU
MTIDPAAVGAAQPTVAVDVERGRLRAFAHAIGETDPVYTDLDAARAAGHPDLPVPPTFLFGLGAGDFAWLTGLGVDLRRVLHGEQHFTYHDVAHAGDTLILAPRIVEVFSKRAGALQFLVREITVRRDDGSAVADLRETMIVRKLGGAS